MAPDQPVSVTKGSWLASSAGVELDTKWGGFKNMFGGEGGFLIHAGGQGTILLACYGALDTISLGEGFVFDFTGPGWVMTQSRNPSALAAWVRQLMPGETGGAAGNVLGGILGR